MNKMVVGWVEPPLHLRADALDHILLSDLSEPALRHAAELAALGYTVIKQAFTPKVCKERIAEINAFLKSNANVISKYRGERNILPRFTNLHMAIPNLIYLFTRNPLLLEVQDFFFGRPTSLYSSLYYQHGSEQPLHRDTPVFCTRPEYNYFGNTVYLEAAGDENGCLEVAPGGHLVGELDREALALNRYASLEDIPQLGGELWNDYQKRVNERCAKRGYKSRKLHVETGDCVIWHPQLPHGGSPIKNAELTRHSFVFHTAPVGARVYHQHAFFHPSKPFSEMASWDQLIVEGRAVVDQAQGVALGHPVNAPLPMAELDLSKVGKAQFERRTTDEAVALLTT